MKNKTRKIIVYMLILLVTISACVCGYKKLESDKIAQEKVIDNFISSFYDPYYLPENNITLESLLSSDYSIDEYDIKQLAVYSDSYTRTKADYKGYLISKSSKEKVNGKKVIVYFVDIDFVNQEEGESRKGRYIELIKENSDWKINKVMPISE